MSAWSDFTTIFNNNKTEMLQTGDSNQDVGFIWNAVEAAAKLGVEERVIFCIIMQESTGNVGVGTPSDMDNNATGGLMQCEGSPAYPGQHGLSQDKISAMVTAGTNHFKSNLQQVGNADSAQCIYQALRLYNSGSMNASNLSNGMGATDSYVSDIANRLQGRTN